MKLIFIFMDGVGLGRDDPEFNPLAKASLPTLTSLLDGRKLVADRYIVQNGIENMIVNTKEASLIALDAAMGVDGAPQSASGQATLLTGKNVAAILGFHDGPKPNPAIMEIVKEGTLFSKLVQRDRKVSFLNAYPPRYFDSIENGHRLPGAIALSARYAGIRLKTREDLLAGDALSADFTGQGWRQHLGFTDMPVLEPKQAGKQIYRLSQESDLAFFEYWLTDVVGHHQDMQAACELLETFDTVLSGIVSEVDNTSIILITSDHGNVEDLSTRHHTRNDVPLLLIGNQSLREMFIKALRTVKQSAKRLSLIDVSPAILECL